MKFKAISYQDSFDLVLFDDKNDVLFAVYDFPYKQVFSSYSTVAGRFRLTFSISGTCLFFYPELSVEDHIQLMERLKLSTEAVDN